VSETIIDMTGRQIVISKPVQRIVSLVPSQTELLYFLGLDDKIVGQTVFCIHPADKHKSSVKVGGTKKIRIDAIRKLKPDLIICNKEEMTPEIVNELSKDFPVWVSDIKNTEDAFKMIHSLGEILDVKERAENLTANIRKSFAQSKIYKKLTCLYLIWRKPYMSVGRDTFISHMMEKGGFINILQDAERYPELDEEQIMALRPELVFLSSEPYPFSDKHISEIKAMLPYSKVMTVDGEMFSWYGIRLVNSQPYLNELQRRIHKGINT